MKRGGHNSRLWQQIERERTRFQALIDATPDGLFFKDTESRFVLANRPVAEVMGAKNPQDLIGKTDHDFYPKSLADEYLADEQKLFSTGGRLVDKVEPKTVGGELRWILVSKGVVFDEAGKPEGFVGTSRDVTEQRKVEGALKRVNRELAAVSKCNQVLIRAENEQSLLDAVCSVICEYAGYRMAWVGYAESGERESVRPVARSGIDEGYVAAAEAIWHDAPRGAGPVGRAIKAGVVVAVQDIAADPGFVPWREAALQRGYRSSIALPLRDETAATFGTLAIYSDEPNAFASGEVQLLKELANDLAYGIVSIRMREAHRQAAEALQNERTLLRTLIDMLPHGIYAKDAAYRKTMANPVDVHVLGRELESEVLEKTDFELYPQDIALAFAEDDRAVIQFGKRVINREEYYFDTSGSKRWLLTSKVPLRDADGKITGLVGLNIDITERKEQLEKMKEQAQLLDISSDAIMVRGLDNRIRYWNKSAEVLFGWAAGEAVGANEDELLHGERPEEPKRALRAVMEKGVWSGELHYRRKDGTEAIGEARWTLVRDERNDPHSILCVSTDVTERRAIEKQLLRAQRLESLGTLAGGVAHDLNNVLTPILAGLELLGPHITDDGAKQSLIAITRSAERGAGVVRQLLGFARGFEGDQDELEPRLVLDEVVRITRETFPRSIDIELRPLPGDLRTLMGSATQLHQVLLNLCLNARDAMDEGGRITISARNVQPNESYVRLHVDARPVAYVLIEVADTGRGMPPEVLEKIFEPFFTTKERGKGTGLGLSTTLSIVKGHGGFITAYSEVGSGSIFRVYLPATAGDRSKQEAKPLSELPAGSGELILLVDDEEYVRQTIGQVLQQGGYRVVTASDGTEAVARYVELRAEIRCVIVDMMMPQMDGATMIRTLRRIDPKVKIIATSGLPSNGFVTKARELKVQVFLEKPYVIEKLLKTVHEVIEDP